MTESRAAGSAESPQLGLCGSPLWHFSAGALITGELFDIKSRRVAKAATLRCFPKGFLFVKASMAHSSVIAAGRRNQL
jgi:hypothetical protein